MSTLDEKLQTISHQVDVLKARLTAMEQAARLLLNDFKTLRDENEKPADRSGAIVRTIPGKQKTRVANAAQ